MKTNILTTGILAILSTGIRYAADTATADGANGTAESVAAAVLSHAEFLAQHPIVETATIELKKLVIDAGTQPRVAIGDETVKDYAETIKQAVKTEQPNPFDSLPPESLPQVFRDPTGRCVLADGFHRYGAHKGAHVKEMTVAIRNGTERDALRFSLGTNTSHGVQRTNKDKQRAVKLALNDPEWATMSNTEIARTAGVSEFLVRELRSTVKAPTVRTVTVRGKKTTMNTAAIGKGKGGGKKGDKAAAKAAKAAAKKGGKKGSRDAIVETSTPATGSKQQEAEQEIQRLLIKISEAIGGEEGGKVRRAVNDGALELTPRDIRDWAGMDAKKIKNIAPLVTGGARMKPAKAFEFVHSQLNEKVIADLHNRALGSGGKYTYEDDNVTITVTHNKK